MLVVRFRPQCGGFDEAMSEMREFPNVDSMLTAVQGLTMEWYCFDNRLSADCFIIENAEGPLGFAWFAEIS